MNEIPFEFWMVIVGVLTFFVCVILYYFGMLLRESTGAVSDARQTIQKANLIVDDSREIVTTVKSAVQEIVKPIKKIGMMLNMVTGFVEGFVGSGDDKK